MIAMLRGVLIEKHPNQAIVDAGGVGYELHIPITTYTHLPETGAEVRLRVYTHVREDTLALYGFLSQDEKSLFEKLLAVSGIGPALAIKVLSGLDAADLIMAIRKGEVERLKALGATEVQWSKKPADADYVILADPEGNRFCVVDASQ